MTKTIFLNLTFVNSLMFMISKQPLTMGIILLFQTLMICMTSGTSSKNFWFSYILFLIFLGGMLILFIYVISLASNEMFSFSLKTLIKNLIFLIFMTTAMTLFIDQFMMNNFMFNKETEMINNLKTMELENLQILNKMFSFPTNMITILLMIYLFMCLIAVCKIIYIFEGPLRPKF